MTAMATRSPISSRSRRPELAEPETISVVLASVNGWDVLGPTLAALDAEPERSRMEVLVVDVVGGETRRRIEAHRPEVVLIAVDERPSIPKLRYLGASEATGDVIAFLEDHGTVDPGWAGAVLESLRGDCGVVGGSVANGRSSLVDDAVFYCEYSAYMDPVIEGDHGDLPGNNIAFRREHLAKHLAVLDEGKWESWITDRLRSEGVPTVSTNRMMVRHIKPFGLGYFVVQRFHFARSYAGMRRVDQDWPRRLIYGFGSLALPAILMARVSGNVLRKRRHLPRFAVCAPLVAMFLGIGAIGEMIGYLFGPGSSLEKVE